MIFAPSRFGQFCFSVTLCVMLLVAPTFSFAASGSAPTPHQQTNSTKMSSPDEMTPEKLFNLLKDGAKVIDSYIAESEVPGKNATERVYNMLHDGAKVVESHFDTSLEASVNATAKLFAILEKTAKELETQANTPMQAGINATEKLFNQLQETVKVLEKEVGTPKKENKQTFKRLQVINQCEQKLHARYQKETFPLNACEATMLLFWQGTPQGETIEFSGKNMTKSTEKLSTILAANKPESIDFNTGELITYSYTLCPDKPALSKYE